MFKNIPYLINCLILFPVVLNLWCYSTESRFSLFDNNVPNVPSLRLLIASFWTSLLLVSIIGIIYPHHMVALLIIQVVYKALYMLTSILPDYYRYGKSKTPFAMIIIFALICVIWPWFIIELI
jgi:hypothetical protein